MITEILINLFTEFLKILVGTITPIHYIFPTEILDTLRNVLFMVSYYLPLDFILPLLSASIAIDIFHIVWKIAIRAKSFIPTMGD